MSIDGGKYQCGVVKSSPIALGGKNDGDNSEPARKQQPAHKRLKIPLRPIDKGEHETAEKQSGAEGADRGDRGRSRGNHERVEPECAPKDDGKQKSGPNKFQGPTL